MSNVVHGKDCLLQCEVDGNYITIGCATSITFTFKNELIGKTDVNAGLFRKKRVRISDCSGAIQGLQTLSNTTSILSVMYFLQEGIRRTEQPLRFVYEDEVGVTRVITGNFLVSEVSITSPVEDFSEFDLTFEGTGGITIGDLPSPPDSECPEVFSDYWQPAAGATTVSGTGEGGKSFASHEIIEVMREIVPLTFTSGVPGDGEYGFNGTTITIWSDNPFNGEEKVLVIWQVTV